MKIPKLARCLAACVFLSGILCVSVKADSVFLVRGGSDGPIVSKLSGFSANEGTANFAFEDGVLSISLFDFDSVSIVSVSQKTVGQPSAMNENSVVGFARSEALNSLFRRNITFTLQDFSGTVVIHFKKSVNGRTEKPVGCLSCPGAPIPNPEPASLLLMGSGLVGVGALVRRRYKRKE